MDRWMVIFGLHIGMRAALRWALGKRSGFWIYKSGEIQGENQNLDPHE